MTRKYPVASRIALFLAVAAIGAIGFAASPANAQQAPAPQKQSSAPKAPKRQYDSSGHLYYGPNGPNVSYQQGPHTRVYVTKRSWLDAGTEVLPVGHVRSVRPIIKMAAAVVLAFRCFG